MPFWFDAPYQFTPLLNLWPHIFSLVPFGWFICIYVSIFFLWEYIFFIYAFLIYVHFFRNTTRV
jgi:hypothetical protein